MGDTRGAREFRAGVIRCSRRQVPEEPLALAQQYWRYRQVHLVDEPGVKELPDGGGAAAKGDVLAVGGPRGHVEHLWRSRVDEAERGPVAHGQVGSRVTG